TRDASLPGFRREHCSEKTRSEILLDPFIIQKEKGAVLANGPPYRRSELVAFQGCLGKPRVQEIIPSVELLIPQKFENTSVNTIASRLRYGTDDTTRSAAVLGAVVILQQHELPDG